ncbi:MAG: SUMF1/EgtB/PvdO family nonheme iron enzyme, partial [Gammaproteobacteria bacterium]|nr:SUMF1/EgtB/PvdO family nonheme iron enzyme [Gammaproteobacteria bacterium]
LQQAHEQSESELRDLRYTHQQSEGELTEVQDIHQQVETELKQSHNVRRQIESELEELKANSRRQAAEQPHDAVASEVEQQLEKLRQELAASEDKHHSALAELEQLNSRVNESEADSEASRQARLESEAKLQELQQAHEQNEAELEELQANSHMVETELQHERTLRQDAEDKLQQGVASTAPDDQGDVGALKSELASLTEALKEADFAYDEIREQAEHLSEEKENTAELMAELEANSVAAREEIAALTSELEQLRLTQGEGPSAAGDEEAVTKEAEALREELKLVQLHSSTEIEELNTALLTARADLKEVEVARGFEKADEESLRLEMDELRESSRRWEQRLTDADSKCRGFEDAIEDRDERIDRITLELEETRLKYSEVESVRQQHEERLNLLRESAGQKAATDGYVDPRLAGPSGDLHLDDLYSGSSSKGSMLLWLFLGAVICFAVVDGVMILAGRGELVTGLLQSDSVMEIEPAVSDRRVAGRPMPERASRAVPAPSVIADAKPISAPEEATAEGAEQEPVWSMLTDIEFGPAMVRLKGGSFTMGSNTNQVSGDEWPAHAISISAFAISREEVTFDEYDRFAQATGHRLPNDEGWGRGKRPVINVSWDDAVAYAEWLSERTGKNYRLPTESEWEFAIRGGSDSPYWWGYQVENARANCFDCGSQWDRGSSAPVGSFPPNNFGLHDMAGNVREWVQDCYHPNYSGAPADGSAWLDPGCAVRVVRGGAYNKTSDSMRSSWRGYFKQDTRLSVAGFRVVRELQ